MVSVSSQHFSRVTPKQEAGSRSEPTAPSLLDNTRFPWFVYWNFIHAVHPCKDPPPKSFTVLNVAEDSYNNSLQLHSHRACVSPHYGKSTKSAAHLPNWRWMNDEWVYSASLHCTRNQAQKPEWRKWKSSEWNTAGCGCLRSQRSSAHLPQLDFKTQTPLMCSYVSLSLSREIKAELCVRSLKKKVV